LLFLNHEITPIVRNLGSIGASGDLVPLAQIAGSIIGLGPGYRVYFQGNEIDARTALKNIGLSSLPLRGREGLALVNGTSVLTAMAAQCIYDARLILNVALGIHGLFIQALLGAKESFDPFIHSLKPHPGQVDVARRMLALLDGSQLTADHELIQTDLVQDRYSIRCLAQYLGPIADGLQHVADQVTIEMNSVDDNPIVDSLRERILCNGNFLGQFVGIGMDQMRYYMALLAKHMDAQIGLLVTPEFNRGLPACLAFEDGRSIKFGLKGLQICGNSILPRLLHLSGPIVPFFPTYAEQFNQNVNSQGFNSAILACESIDLMSHYLAVACIFAVQAVEQRSFSQRKSYLAAGALSPALVPMYETIYDVLQKTPSITYPLISSNSDQHLDELVEEIYRDLKDPDSKLFGCVCFETKSTRGPRHGTAKAERMANFWRGARNRSGLPEIPGDVDQRTDRFVR
jgi:phenylalanine ammonia-lyase